jgi:hypothetical protein
MTLTAFDPPGFLDDFDQAQKDAWHEFISQRMEQAAAGFPDQFDNDAPRAQFFNQAKVDTDPDEQTLDITWTAFPRTVTVNTIGDRQRWRQADSSRELQDEYCEWSVQRDPGTDKIVRITFTCEAPEYWAFLASAAPDRALALYREHIDPNVQLNELFLANGRYNPRNRWNASTVNGAMHLIQPSNTLSAEIELAAGASVVRMVGGNLLTGEQELIKCGQYGAPERHSDPHIGAQVNSLTRQKADVTLQNPIGLYFHGLDTAGWETPDGSDPGSFWSYPRGSDDKPVRAVFEVPAGHGFVVGDITIGGRTIDFGAQVADRISMKLTGVATRFGRSNVAPMTACRRPKEFEATPAAGPLRVQDVLDSTPSWTRS